MAYDRAVLVFGEDGMEEFLKAFARNPYGSWTCVAPATLRNPYWSIKYTEGAIFRPGPGTESRMRGYPAATATRIPNAPSSVATKKTNARPVRTLAVTQSRLMMFAPMANTADRPLGPSALGQKRSFAKTH